MKRSPPSLSVDIRCTAEEAQENKPPKKSQGAVKVQKSSAPKQQKKSTQTEPDSSSSEEDGCDSEVMDVVEAKELMARRVIWEKETGRSLRSCRCLTASLSLSIS